MTLKEKKQVEDGRKIIDKYRKEHNALYVKGKLTDIHKHGELGGKLFKDIYDLKISQDVECISKFFKLSNKYNKEYLTDWK